MVPLAIGESIGNKNEIPAKVQAAQSYLYYEQSCRFPSGAGAMPGDSPMGERDLSRREQAAYDAAIGVLIAYFNGEMDFGDVNPGERPADPDDDPKDPVPVI